MRHPLFARAALAALFVLACGTSFLLGAAQAPASGPQLTNPARGGLRMLLDAPQLGGPEVSVGERTYPAGYQSAEHTHQSIEVLYVLSGEYQHEVDGQTHVLTAGMLGFVKPGQKVRHKTGSGSTAKVLMVWVPGADGTEQARTFTGTVAR
jgi:quercetin dioxygenase-like cupin family protein